MKIFPVYYFPSVSWFAAAVHAETIVLEKWQYYRKQHFFNRMEIKTPDKVLRLSLPIKKAGEHTPIALRQISQEGTWRPDHWKSIESALRSSPYFEFFEDRIATFYEERWDSLFDYNLAIITMVRDSLRLPITWTVSEKYLPTEHYELDYREAFDPKDGHMPPWFQAKSYLQVFGDVFSPDLSILDLMCNKGPETERILRESFRVSEKL
ncbi:MAG TPA: WbqC family protein, partial [Bacteroidia bacterium]|nr:WbqC family protein [Bacteroidia bacterium]